MDLSPICIGLLLSHWNVFCRLLHGSMIYADSEMVLLLVADMVGCPFTELEETTCDFSVHVAFFLSCEHWECFQENQVLLHIMTNQDQHDWQTVWTMHDWPTSCVSFFCPGGHGQQQRMWWAYIQSMNVWIGVEWLGFFMFLLILHKVRTWRTAKGLSLSSYCHWLALCTFWSLTESSSPSSLTFVCVCRIRWAIEMVMSVLHDIQSVTSLNQGLSGLLQSCCHWPLSVCACVWLSMSCVRCYLQWATCLGPGIFMPFLVCHFMHSAGQQRSLNWHLQSFRSAAQQRNWLKISVLLAVSFSKVTDLSFNQEWMLNVPWPLYSHLILLPCGPMGPRQWQFHGRQSLSLHRFSIDCLVNEFQVTVLFSAFMACQWLSDFVSVTRTVTLWPFGFWSTWERQSSQCQCQTSWQMIQLDNQPF